jgi:hypothetical protein
MTRRLATAAALSLAALTVAGCGDDNKAHDAYVKSADALCEKADAIGQAMNQEFMGAMQSGNNTGAAEVIRGFQPTYRQRLDALTNLKPPADEAERAKAVVSLLNQRADIVVNLARAVEANDQQLMSEVATKQQQVTRKASELAGDYGFKVCGGPQPSQTAKK